MIPAAGRARQAGARRAVLLLPAGLALLSGLDAALMLLGLPAPVTADRLPEVHGMVMVLGFAGTLVALERAVALGSRWGYLSPIGLGAGGLLLVTPVDLLVGRLLLTAGAAVLLALYVRFWRRQPSPALLAQAAGAVSALGAALLWLGGLDVPRLLPWLAAFLILTIAGERLELARVALLAPRVEHAFVGCVGAVLAGTVASLLWPALGTVLLGAALLALVGWLIAHDVARRLLRSTGLPRFTAACLLAGYAWLGLAGALWLLSGPVAGGSTYDAVVHTVFLGFVISMIMAHAPVILPAVLRRPLPYRPVLAVPAWLLHASLALRILVGDLRDTKWAWQWGGVFNIVAVLLFVLTAAALSVTAGNARRGTAGRSAAGAPGGSGEHPAERARKRPAGSAAGTAGAETAAGTGPPPQDPSRTGSASQEAPQSGDGVPPVPGHREDAR